MAHKYIFEVYEGDLPKDWDAFVEASPFGSIHQYDAWKHFQQKVPGRETVIGFGVREQTSGALCGVCLCIKMETGIQGSFWWYSSRGPVFDPEKHKKAGVFLINAIEKKLSETQALYWRVSLPFSSETYQMLGLPAHKQATKMYNPTDTLMVDLGMEEADILAQMKRKGRYNIHLARKKGVTVRRIDGAKVTQDDIEDFFVLMKATTLRDGFGGHNGAYYLNMCQQLGSKAQLFFAVYDGVPIAAAITTLEASRAIYYFGASTSDARYRNLMAPYLLQWEMMVWAKNNGGLSYDFLGIAPADQPDHAYAGITAFKKKFGGSRMTYHPGIEIRFRPFWYMIYSAARKMRQVLKRFV